MFCPACSYRWKSRRSTAPARCPACGQRNVHQVTLHEPTPRVAPGSIDPSFVIDAPADGWAACTDDHRKLEAILRNPDVSLQQKALSTVLLTGNAHPTNLMHRLKVSEAEAADLLRRLEAGGHVTPPDESGERDVT
jgi:hypothetical protein